MTERLETLFLRHGATGEGERELKEEFEAAIERLTNIVGEWGRRVAELPQRRHPSHLINACDEAISLAIRAAEVGDYAAAFDALRRGDGAIAEIRRAWEANLTYDDARAAYRVLEALLPSPSLKPLLTLRDLALLLDQTLSLLERRSYAQAGLLGRACRHRSEMLCEQQGGGADDELGAWRGQLSALCDEAARFLPPGRGDSADKAALAGVDALLRQRRRALAGRLLHDLEVELTPHRTFLEAYARFRPPPPGDDAAARAAEGVLRELICAQSWEAATSHLLRGALAGLGERLARATDRAAAIRQQLAALERAPRAAR